MPRASISAASEPAALRRVLQRWYRAHGRHALPWRLTRDPYAILVSEVMLQQTQVDRVLAYYAAWLERWPTVGALAEASPADVIRHWRGLGYNRRALNLHRVAVAVAQDHSGDMPTDAAELRRLPGVGPYTESAVRCFARGETVPVADTNIARVLARLIGGAAGHPEFLPGALTSMAAALLPARNARDHNLALMDLGALVCTARSPKCEACPVRAACAWRARGYPPAAAVSASAPRFETTARFARGRIIDHLRESPATEVELAAILPPAHGRRVSTYLTALEQDGLITQFAPATWSLPR